MNDTYDIPLERVLNDSISNNEVLKKENVKMLSNNKEGSLEHQMEYDDYSLNNTQVNQNIRLEQKVVISQQLYGLNVSHIV